MTGARTRALRTLAGAPTDVDVVPLGSALPRPDAYCAVVADGLHGPPPDWVAELASWVEQGGTLLVIAGPRCDRHPGAGRDDPWSSLLGTCASPSDRAGTAPLDRAGPPPGPAPSDPAPSDRAGTTLRPPTEWFAKVASTTGRLTERVPEEFPVVDCFQPLHPAPGAEVVLAVNVAFCDRAALVVQARGRGQVAVSGLGSTDRALAQPDLAMVLSRALVAPQPSLPPRRDLGLAVIGYGPYGGMGQHHGLAARATPGLEFVATCEPDPGRRKAAEADFPGVRAYATVEDLAADPDVEVVVVATPPASHTELALSMLRAGKHVACEKPMCFTTAQADQLMAAAAEHGRALTVNQNRRWDPDFRAVRRAVETGLLGEVFNAETFVGSFEHPCRAWHSEASISGGVAYDWGSHHLDWILQLMAGAPARVVAHGHKRVWHDVTNLDQLRIHLTWEDGREAEFVHSDVAAVRRPKFYLQGTAGTLVGRYRPVTFERIEVGRGYVAEPAHHAEAPAELTLARYESDWGLTETRLPPAPDQPFAFHRNLADHLHRGEALAVTPGSVRGVIAVLEAAQQSSMVPGSTVTLPRH